MSLLLILVAIFAGLSLLPDGPRQKYGIQIPGLKLKKSTAQGLLFGALVIALVSLKLFPFAFFAALVGGSVMAISWWRERALDETLRDEALHNRTAAGQGGAGQGDGAARKAALSRMSLDEALDVLGLDASATRQDVDATYRKLMAQIHPDKGGTDYLAAKINEAREVLKKTL